MLPIYVGIGLGTSACVAHTAGIGKEVVMGATPRFAVPYEPLKIGSELELPREDIRGHLIPKRELTVVALPTCGSCTKFPVPAALLHKMKGPLVLIVDGDLRQLDPEFRDDRFFLVSRGSIPHLPDAIAYYSPQAAHLGIDRTMTAVTDSSDDVLRFLGDHK